MPWCEACSRFLNPNSLTPSGDCPSCGRHVADPEAEPARAEGAAAGGPAEPRRRSRWRTPPPEEVPEDWAESYEPPKAPWHFWLMVAAVVVYLGWRLVQLVVWLVT